MRILVMAKAPVPGRVKTRLCPPCTPDEAATIASAALEDTLCAALATGVEVVLALAGPAPSWIPRRRVRVVAQHGDSFNERLEHAWQQMRGGAVQIGMDTPHVSPAVLLDACRAVHEHGAALGAAADGGWWALGLNAPVRGAFDGVEMSTASTGRRQRQRLEALGTRPVRLPVLTDVDEWHDARRVARIAPHTRFAAAVAAVEARATREGA